MSKTARVTRRKFLQGAAVTFAAPYMITSNALGAAGQPAANNRINIGFIGIGNQGSGLLGGFLGKTVSQVIAVCDVNSAHREEARRRCEEKYKGVSAYNDFREMLARNDIDAVVIAVPDHWHAIISIEAAKAGKDIYCEKPLSLTIREAIEMRDTMNRYGRVFQTGSMQRSMREFQRACELVLNGRIGQVKQLNIGLPNNGLSSSEYGIEIAPDEPVPAGFDYDLWLGPAPWRPYNPKRVSGNYGGGWRYVRDYSGGMMTDWGAHHFDIAQWGLGMDGSGPVEVIPPDGKDVKTLTYVYNIKGQRVPMMLGDAGGGGVKFTGETGVIEVNRGFFKATPEAIGKKEQETRPYEVSLNRGRWHDDDFLECIKTRQRPIADINVGCSSAIVCHLGNIAKWVGRPIKWDPVKEEIVGDEEANRWVDRPYRTPWRLV